MKRRLIFLVIVMLSLLVVSLFSCSSDDNRIEQPKLTLLLHSNEQLSLVSIRILDNDMHTIHSYDYQNKSDITLDIYDGTRLTVYTVDEDEFEYTYNILNNNGTVQSNGNVFDSFNYTLFQTYIVQ